MFHSIIIIHTLERLTCVPQCMVVYVVFRFSGCEVWCRFPLWWLSVVRVMASFSVVYLVVMLRVAGSATAIVSVDRTAGNDSCSCR